MMIFSSDKCTASAINSFEPEASIDSCSESNLRTACVLHIVLNRLSLCCTAVTYGGVVLVRQDGLATWALVGCILNVLLSFTLKKILNQERPVSKVCSGPGMPSTHAQSISFAIIFFIHSIVGWLGFNVLSVVLSVLVITVGAYFSWLRVVLHYHTTCQVVAGAVVGSIFSVLWFCSCDGFKDMMLYKLCLWV